MKSDRRLGDCWKQAEERRFPAQARDGNRARSLEKAAPDRVNVREAETRLSTLKNMSGTKGLAMTQLTYLEAAVVGLIQGVPNCSGVQLGHNVLLPALVGGSWAKD